MDYFETSGIPIVINKKPLREEVFDLLQERIVAGKFPPGKWLRQEEISTQLGVSQTPVREALDLLASVGLAERVPYRGVRVPEWSHQEIADAYVMRLQLETTAVRLAAANRSAEQLLALGVALKQTELLTRLEDMPAHRRMNRLFHLLIAEASGNTLLRRLFEMASNQFPDWQLYEYMYRHPELLEPSLKREYREHESILAAITAGRPEEAEKEIINHIRELRHELISFLSVPEEMILEREAQLIMHIQRTAAS
jgi:DNA-binding GntR family transcriptional regulator